MAGTLRGPQPFDAPSSGVRYQAWQAMLWGWEGLLSRGPRRLRPGLPGAGPGSPQARGLVLGQAEPSARF